MRSVNDVAQEVILHELELGLQTHAEVTTKNMRAYACIAAYRAAVNYLREVGNSDGVADSLNELYYLTQNECRIAQQPELIPVKLH